MAEFDNEVLQQEQNRILKTIFSIYLMRFIFYDVLLLKPPPLLLQIPDPISIYPNHLHFREFLVNSILSNSGYVNFFEATITRIQILILSYSARTVSSLALPAGGMIP